MNKTIHSQQSECVHKLIVALRTKAGLTQRQLADKLEREHSFIGRLELGERRLDMVEFFWLCQACGTDPVKESAKLMRALRAVQSETAK
ncbi:MAG: helix-turn-helix domain protein [Pedosphaera sp.]|nr:helix-turn-helix domain protein [Pedosphaera sp.]